MADIYNMCASTVYQDGAFCIPQVSAQLPLDDSGVVGNIVDPGQIMSGQALGVTALPCPPDDNGTAEGVVIENIGGMNGVFVSGWDVRAADVAGELSPGDTCLHGTHSDATKRAKFFCKDGIASIVVGSGTMLTIDLEAGHFSFTGFGCLIQCSNDGIKIADGGTTSKVPQCWIELKGGVITLAGSVVIGGAAAVPGVPQPVAYMSTVTGSPALSACLAVTG